MTARRTGLTTVGCTARVGEAVGHTGPAEVRTVSWAGLERVGSRTVAVAGVVGHTRRVGAGAPRTIAGVRSHSYSGEEVVVDNSRLVAGEEGSNHPVADIDPVVGEGIVLEGEAVGSSHPVEEGLQRARS